LSWNSRNITKREQGFYCFLFFTFFSSFNSAGQTYKGTVIDAESRESLQGVICEALDRNTQVVSYTISTAGGVFSLSPDKPTQSLVFKFLGYEKKELLAEEISNPVALSVELRKDIQILKEVVVSVPPIVKSNDTIRYDATSFRGQEDRYVADLLKKLPGIKVNENGSVSYQGEAISNFYIEGRDLLGGQYGQATNNLTVDAVLQVEVFENHQAIQALKGIEFSRKAAINLRLKKGYTIKPFGEIQLGAGGLPCIYDNKLFVLNISNKVQSLVNFKINNTGRNLLTEMENHLDVKDLLSYEPLPENLLIPPSPQDIPINDNRYLFNKNYLGSINHLLALSKYTEIRTTLSYGNDRFTQDFFSQQNYADGKDFLQINEQTGLINRIDNYRLSFIVENNSPDHYIKNESILFGKKQKTNSDIDSNTGRLATYNKNSPAYVQNYFQALVKYNGDKTVKINSFTRYSCNGELLNVNLKEDSIGDWEETFQGKYLTNKTNIGVAGNLLGQRLGMGVDITYKRRSLDQCLPRLNIEVPNSINIQNSENVTELFQWGISPDYRIKQGDKFVTILQVPLTYSTYKAKNNEEKPFMDGRWLFMPSITSNYKINHRWELTLRLGNDCRYADDKSLLYNPYFRNYRTIYMPSQTLNGSKNYNAAMQMRYKDLIELLFFNMQVFYRQSAFDYINKMYYSNDWNYISTEERKNTGSQFQFLSDLSKTFLPLKLTLTLNPSYTQMKSHFIQQNILMSNTSRSAMLSLKAELKSIKRMFMIYQTVGNFFWNDNNLTNRIIQRNMNQKVLVYYFPNKNMDVSTTFEYALLERNQNSYDSYAFWDISTGYKYKKVEFSILLTNLLNESVYSVLSLSTVNSTFQRLQMRGREILLTVKTNF